MTDTTKYLVMFSDKDKVMDQNFDIHQSLYHWPNWYTPVKMLEMAQHEADQEDWVIDEIYRLELVCAGYKS